MAGAMWRRRQDGCCGDSGPVRRRARLLGVGQAGNRAGSSGALIRRSMLRMAMGATSAHAPAGRWKRTMANAARGR
ncbi:hypothetical protein D3C86_1827690 [compost metagenome]